MSVLSVSSNWSELGETLAIIMVRHLPPSESLSSRVSFESRYGMWPAREVGYRIRCRGEQKVVVEAARPSVRASHGAPPFLEESASAEIQLASARSERLMLAPSLSRLVLSCVPPVDWGGAWS